MDNFRLDSVKVYYQEDDKVIGMQLTYEVNGYYIQGERHLSSTKDLREIDYEVKNIDLEIDEFITKVSGRAGSVIDNIRFETSKGRSIEAGGEGGDEFELDIPEGYCVGYISGGRNGHVHNIRVYSGPTPRILTSKMRRQK